MLCQTGGWSVLENYPEQRTMLLYWAADCRPAVALQSAAGQNRQTDKPSTAGSTARQVGENASRLSIGELELVII